MKYLFSSMLLLVFYTNSFAQVGIFSQFHIQGAPIFYASNSTVYNDNIHLVGSGIDYTFRLKNYRIEFFPALVYLAASNYYVNNITDLEVPLDYKIYGLQFNTHFYIFDIEGDCHCPTWSKDGTLIKKGFYLSVSLNEYADSYKPGVFPREQFFYSAVSFGAGLDIGISKHLTITPSIQYELQQRKLMLGGFDNNEQKQNQVNNLMLGLRLGYSFKDH